MPIRGLFYSKEELDAELAAVEARLKKQHDAELAALKAILNTEHKAKCEYLENGWRTETAQNAALADDAAQKLKDNKKLSAGIITANEKLEEAEKYNQVLKMRLAGDPKPEIEMLKLELQKAETLVKQLEAKYTRLKARLKQQEEVYAACMAEIADDLETVKHSISLYKSLADTERQINIILDNERMNGLSLRSFGEDQRPATDSSKRQKS